MLNIGPNTDTQNTDASSSKFCEISQNPPYSSHTKPLLHSSTTTHKCLKIFISPVPDEPQSCDEPYSLYRKCCSGIIVLVLNIFWNGM